MRKSYITLGALLSFCTVMPMSSSPQPPGIEILCQKSHFTPSTIHVKKGEPVLLVLKSADVSHGFAIDELGIAREVCPGPSTNIRIKPDRAGTYPFYCVVRCGREHLKMRGTMIVE
jgi:cytochrome c oxidase subunit 2